jgi:hypothetical protein
MEIAYKMSCIDIEREILECLFFMSVHLMKSNGVSTRKYEEVRIGKYKFYGTHNKF